MNQMMYNPSKLQSLFLLLALLALLDLALEKVEVLLKLSPLLADGGQHFNDALVLLLLSDYRKVQAADAEDHLPELSLPLSVLVELAL